VSVDAAAARAAAEAAPSWTPSRDAALARLAAFAPLSGPHYARTRNFDFGPARRDNVSMLSPWLRCRLLLEEEVLDAALRGAGLEGAEKFVQEVFWRGYFKGWLEHRPDVWRRYRREVTDLVAAMDRDGALRRRYENAVGGETGIDCFDAWSRELRDTGYLHNHARMWFASIWIFTLRLPWSLGADFFYRFLLDGDPASNTLSWRWVAGLHTRGKHYLARADNIRRYTEGRFYPAGRLDECAQPLEEEIAVEPRSMQLPKKEGGAIPAPAGLLVTEEDCMPEDEALAGVQPVAAAGLSCAALRSPLPVSAAAADFAQAAVSEGLKRIEAVYGLPCERIEPGLTEGPDVDAVRRWARAQGLSTVVTAFAPVGPAREFLDRLRERLTQDGVLLVERARRYDRVVWPHAPKGFFGLKKKIPAILQDLNLL